MPVTIDKFEYATDLAAQAAWVSFAESHYPVAQNNTYVKSTTRYNNSYYPHNATNPANSLIGHNSNGWCASNGTKTNQRFHIDLGEGHIINRIYYENYHSSGSFIGVDSGVQNFTLWGSNEASAFAELTYAIDTNWTQLTTSQSTFDKHVAANQADPKYIDVINTTSYRYYAFKFANTYGNGDGYMGLRRVELQIAEILTFSESTIKKEGSYSMKIVAPQTTYQTFTRTVSPTINLTDQDDIKLWVRASRTGTNFKIGFHDSGGTTTESNIAISSADTWEEKTIDISAVANANKNAIDLITITVTNADAENTIYLDEMMAYVTGEGTGTGGGISRARIVNGA